MSIYKKIILIAGIILSIAIGINTIVSTNFFNREYSKLLESRAIVIGQTLKSQLDRLFSLGIPLNELVGFEEQCKEVVNKYKDVKNAMVVDLQGKILFHNDPAQQSKILTNTNILKYLNEKKDTPAVIRDYRGNYYDIILPIYNLDNQRVGVFVIEFSLEPIVQKTRALISYSFFVTLVSLIIAIGLLFWGVNLWVNRPLTKLLLAIREIGEKGVDFKGRVEIDSKDELGRLAHSFNQMTEDLQRTTVSRDELAKEISERKRTEAALRESESKHRTLLTNIPQKIFYKDLNSVYMLCNEAYAKDLNIKPAEIKGKTDYDFYPKELANKHIADDKRIMQSGKMEDMEEEYIKEGQKFIIQTIRAPVKGEQGNTIGIFGIFWDITERQKAEEQQRLLLKDLEDANRIMVGRELKMVELKKEINRLSQELGRPVPYDEASLGG